MNIRFILSWMCFLMLACRASPPQGDSSEYWQKIELNFKNIDADGLAGPPDGKQSVNYELCIPAQAKYWRKVKKIDPSLQRFQGSKGRIGCSENQWLLIGNTHQADYKKKLYTLAQQSFVVTIREVFWE